MKRTNYAGNITEEYLNQTITVKGWVAKRRNLGGLIFIDLRDREGIVQIVVNPETAAADVAEAADKARNEFVLEVTGKVVERASKNDKIKTGGIEIEATAIEILSTSKTTPFEIKDDVEVLDDTRLKYRYLDLRRPEMLKNITMRHATTRSIREYLDGAGFIDVETPFLNKSTPEGARDYLVPSRVNKGEFYALPQSPQLMKQLLMTAGLDRYYQIVKCFRDEDLRGDRQPEFTQVDLETSFLSEEEIQDLTEELIAKVMNDVKGIDVTLPFPRMKYDDAMNFYGSDKPDTRFELLLTDLSALAKTIDFKVFQEAEVVKAIVVKDAADKYSRKSIDKLTEQAKQNGAKGLAWVKFEKGEFAGGVSKFLAESTDSFVNELKLTDNDLVLFVADSLDVANSALGALRLTIGKQQGLIDFRQFNFLWVIDWPMFEWSDEEERYMSAHHPFTLPTKETQAFLSADGHSKDSDLKKVRAHAYDIVLNGYELGGGSLRINTRQLQEEMLSALGFKLEDANEQFGFLLEALDYGFPPHGGLALGLDRFVMLLAGKDNIREVIAFPKNNKASDPMTQAPSIVAEKQLEELSIKLANKDQ
ncbi:aspartate--tRNA ligase [Lactococcus lactis]|uniref:aspartate--tRNA ligase n=1 Tax=Lactococcus lactis TaxID=1358 RepID=UPI001EEEEDED|nr:aspartate--tRNA ligase [Lactococcus lactis]MCG1001524.1 aspartate--tRNA ligase [Lactococcus lactis]MDG4974818.1 aspartate--tRNA ligase [Lactococcus lactis]WFR75869.1 aspartate--tRNA ligase [Lactococcus lactis]